VCRLELQNHCVKLGGGCHVSAKANKSACQTRHVDGTDIDNVISVDEKRNGKPLHVALGLIGEGSFSHNTFWCGMNQRFTDNLKAQGTRHPKKRLITNYSIPNSLL
jgi:hypothetical protein